MNFKELSTEELLNIKLDYIKNNASPDEIEYVVDKFFQFYRRNGFPYYNLSKEDLEKEYNKFHKYNISKLQLENNEIQQIMHGLSICNNFHPQMWSVKCRDRLSPMDVYLNDDTFRLALKKRVMMSDSKMSLFNVRKSLKIFSGAQSVSNFRPSVAKYLYEIYAKNGDVLDPCAGYGGRMLGASKTVKSYLGIDPSESSNLGNDLMGRFIKTQNKFDYHLKNQCFENFSCNSQFDFIFTSPPYFNVEKYSNEATQSWIRYPEYEQWVEKFLRKLIQNSYDLLKRNCFFCLNVHGNDIIKDSLEITKKTGFVLDETLNMRLSKICGRGQNKNVQKFKHEPIFVFKKY